MRFRKGKAMISETDIKVILEDVTLSRMLFHYIESIKQLYPKKFELDVPLEDVYELEGAIDFQYLRLYRALESDSYFKEYLIKLLDDVDYREMQIDEYFTLIKPLYHVDV